MSSFQRSTKHPATGVIQSAEWIDDHFGPHRYGVRFSDGRVFREEDIAVNCVVADTPGIKTKVTHWNGATE